MFEVGEVAVFMCVRERVEGAEERQLQDSQEAHDGAYTPPGACVCVRACVFVRAPSHAPVRVRVDDKRQIQQWCAC